MFKTIDNKLVGVQVTRMLTSDVKKVKAGAVLNLLERVGLGAGDIDKLHLVLVPRPKMQEKARLVLVDSAYDQEETTNDHQHVGGDPGKSMSGKAKTGKKNKVVVKAADLGLTEYTVWGVPLNYGLRYVGLK